METIFRRKRFEFFFIKKINVRSPDFKTIFKNKYRVFLKH